MSPGRRLYDLEEFLSSGSVQRPMLVFDRLHNVAASSRGRCRTRSPVPKARASPHNNQYAPGVHLGNLTHPEMLLAERIALAHTHGELRRACRYYGEKVHGDKYAMSKRLSYGQYHKGLTGDLFKF